MKRRSFGSKLLIGVALCLFLLSAWGVGKTAEKITIKHFMDVGGAGQAMTGGFQLFNKTYPQYKIEPVRTPWEGMFEKWMAELIAKAGAYDVMNYNSFWLQQGAPYFEDLLPSINEQGPALSEFLGVLGSMWKIDDRILGLPVRVGIEVIQYARKDLLAEAGLEVPETWSDYMQAARKLTKDTDGDGETDIWGAEIKAGGEPQTSLVFTMWVTSRGGRFLTPDGKDIYPLVSKYWDRVRDALTGWRELYAERLVPAGVLTWSIWEALEYFQEGKLGMALLYSPRVALVEDPETSRVAGKVAYAPIPHDTEEWGVNMGGWALGIPNYISEKRRKAAYPYIKFMTEYDAQLEMALNFANGPTRIDVFNSKAYGEVFPAGEAVIKSAEHYYSPPVFYVKEGPEVRLAISDTVQAVVEGRETPESGAKKLHASLKKIMGF